MAAVHACKAVVKPKTLYKNMVKDAKLAFYGALIIFTAIICCSFFLDVANEFGFA